MLLLPHLPGDRGVLQVTLTKHAPHLPRVSVTRPRPQGVSCAAPPCEAIGVGYLVSSPQPPRTPTSALIACWPQTHPVCVVRPPARAARALQPPSPSASSRAGPQAGERSGRGKR